MQTGEKVMLKLNVEDLNQKQANEEDVVDSIEEELTDEQLLQMAEGTCSWGANCTQACT
jgi:hypothetical protein